MPDYPDYVTDWNNPDVYVGDVRDEYVTDWGGYESDYSYSDFDFSDAGWNVEWDDVFFDGDPSPTYGESEWASGGAAPSDDEGLLGGYYKQQEEKGIAPVPSLLANRQETPAERNENKPKDEDDFWDSLLDIFKNPAVLSAIIGGTGAAVKGRAADKQAEALLKGKSQDLDWQKEKFYQEFNYRKERDAAGEAERAAAEGREASRTAGLGTRTRPTRTRRFVKN